MNKIVKTGLIVGGILLVIGIYLNVRANKNSQSKIKSLDPKVEDPDLHKKYNLDLIPDGKGNYRSGQFTAEQLPYVIKKYNIKRIIRLNGDGADSKHKSSDPGTPRSIEKSICEANGCEYNYVYGGEGYVRGQGYTKSRDKVKAILDKGNTLIHCAHGADRTGGMVGGYLKISGIMTDIEKLWNYTLQYNSWDYMIRKNIFFGSGFDKYADTFYPIDLLKKKYGK